MATTELAPVLTLTKQQQVDQAVQQYAYDPAVIDQAVMLGDMKQMAPEMRLGFYKAVCLSVGLNPLSQPFTAMERQDKTIWLYANATCAQQLAAMHDVSFRNWTRKAFEINGEPLYSVTVTAALPTGRSTEGTAIVSLTKKRRQVAGQWPSGDPKFRDVLGDDGEPALITLRGESLANAMMRCETKCFRRATLALVGLGWMASDLEGQRVLLNMQTGELQEDARQHVRPRLLERPEEQAKSPAEHLADLSDPRDPTFVSARAPQPAGELGIDWLPRIEAAIMREVRDPARQAQAIEDWMTWARRNFKKELHAFTVEDWQGFLKAVQAAAKHREGQRRAENAQEGGGKHQEGTSTPQDVSADLPAADTSTGVVDATASPREGLSLFQQEEEAEKGEQR